MGLCPGRPPSPGAGVSAAGASLGSGEGGRVLIHTGVFTCRPALGSAAATSGQWPAAPARGAHTGRPRLDLMSGNRSTQSRLVDGRGTSAGWAHLPAWGGMGCGGEGWTKGGPGLGSTSGAFDSLLRRGWQGWLTFLVPRLISVQLRNYASPIVFSCDS